MNVAIAGYGVEGKSSYDYWKARGADITIVDEREVVEGLPPAPTILGGGAFSRLDDFDMLVRSPSIRPDKIQTKGKVWSATNEFFAKCPATIIGVTGTKGKGTTCSLIASILRAAGKTVHLVGNIGVPALKVLPEIKPDDIVVYELSSFQLWDIEKSPHIAVILMIEPDHLDVHMNMQEYVDAKANIRRFQTASDSCLYHPTNKFSEQVAATPLVGFDSSQYGGSIAFAHRYAVKEENQVYIDGGYFCVQDRRICETSALKLPGAHNLENACAAMSAVSELMYDQISNEAYAQGLGDFAGLPHRLKFVAEKNDVRYYDDSIATTPGSAIAALRSFDDSKTLILGGQEKGADYTELMQLCSDNNVTVLAMGANRQLLAKLAAEHGVVHKVIEGDMRAVVQNASELAQAGSVVILSPAAASFDMFKNYADRGEQFARAVEELS